MKTHQRNPYELFVGDLSFFCEEQDLFEIFGAFGTVEGVRIVRNDGRNRSLMFGFVCMTNSNDAMEAINHLHNKIVMGRVMKVELSEKRSEESKRPIAHNQGIQVHLGFTSTFPRHAVVKPTEQFLRKLFDKYGNIADVVVREYTVHQTQNRQEGYGFITFSTEESAVAAVSECSCLIVDGIIVNATMSHRHVNSPTAKKGSTNHNHTSVAGQQMQPSVSSYQNMQMYNPGSNPSPFSSISGGSLPSPTTAMDPYIRQQPPLSASLSPSHAYRLQQQLQHQQQNKPSPRYLQQLLHQQQLQQQALQQQSPRFQQLLQQQQQILQQQQQQMLALQEESRYYQSEVLASRERENQLYGYGLDRLPVTPVSMLSDNLSSMSLSSNSPSNSSIMTEAVGAGLISNTMGQSLSSSTSRKPSMQQLFPPPIHIPPADTFYYQTSPPQPSPIQHHQQQHRMMTGINHSLSSSSSSSSPSVRHTLSAKTSGAPSPSYGLHNHSHRGLTPSASATPTSLASSSYDNTVGSIVNMHMIPSSPHIQAQHVPPVLSAQSFTGRTNGHNSPLANAVQFSSSLPVHHSTVDISSGGRSIHLPYEPSPAFGGVSFATESSVASGGAAQTVLDPIDALIDSNDYHLVPSIPELDKDFL